MLGNIVRVRHVSNLVRYVLGKPRAQILEVDSLTQDPSQFSKEVLRLAEHRPRLKKLVAHADIDLRPGLRLTDREWREVARQVRERMGFGNSPFLLVRHHDTDHDHVHLLMGTVRYDGTVVKDSFEIKRFQAAVGEVAQSLGMQVERAPDRSAGHRSQYWADRRALGKQFAAAQVRRQYQLTPEDRQLMVRQNQLLGRGRTEISLSPADRPDSVLRIEPERLESRPALRVPDPGPPPPMPPRWLPRPTARASSRRCCSPPCTSRSTPTASIASWQC